MSVLIGITSKNRCEILPKAIASALNQDYTPLAVSVFDDHSTDNTYQIKDQFPNINWEMALETMGLVYARNKMMRESTALYFCSLDDDAWFLSNDVISKAVAYFEQHTSVAAIAFDILSADFPKSRKIETPYEAANFIGCGHILRLDAIKKVGFYDIFPCSYGAEEKDLCLKLIDHDYQIVFMQGVHIWHDKKNLDRDVKEKYFSNVCNDLAFMYRRSPFIFVIPALLLKTINHFRFSILYSKGNLVTSFIKGVWIFLVQLFTFKLQRKPVSLKAFQKFQRLKGVKYDE